MRDELFLKFTPILVENFYFAKMVLFVDWKTG